MCLAYTILLQHIAYASVHCDDSDEEEEDEGYTPTSILIEGREDELGEIEFPDETEDEDEDDDDSWEQYDACDFDEDEADLGDIGPNALFPSLVQEEAEPDSCTYSLTCPVCQLPPKTTCSTACGHLFCGG